MTSYFSSLISLLAFISYALYSDKVAAQNTLTIAQEPRAVYQRDEYLKALLQQALAAANYSAKLKTVIVHPHQQRALIALEDNGVDLYWSMTSPERETLAIAIKVPLFKGYIGKRALVTKQESLSRFATVSTAEQLKGFTAIQGHDWPDTKILAHNDLPVRPFANYQAMFNIVLTGRVDYFPRSFIEVTSELKEKNNEGLVIVPNLYISYPSAFYYFVAKHKPELAKSLEQGLAIMQKNGSFDQLFAQYFADDLKALPFDSANTVEIKLENPYFQH
ncbi:MAG: substrate-binding periplasmic protein [Pseudoalteromonas prydzensis]|jgi:ABC-type amino acid transport substrate-binding protein|uniref:substrate-binding periplasmic protein n=1 Tax=Pseudoalteromonas prydzensis TaxID=182141 RepID=UPI0024BD2AD6|nr:transporter substrate-binding domain-containing protein [Pseudoalteromonas prydzensis]